MMNKPYQLLLLWSLALILFLTACGGGTTPDFSNQEGARVDIFASLGRSTQTQKIETQGVPSNPETGETGVTRAELEVFSSSTRLFFRDGNVVDEAQGEAVTLTPNNSEVTLSLPAGGYRFDLTAFDERDNVLAKGQVEQQVTRDSRVSIPLTSLIGSARFEVPESVKGNQVFDAFLEVSPPNRPDLRVPLGDFSVSYEVGNPSVQLPGSSNIGVRVAAACDAVNVSVTVDNDLSDAVSASASIPVNDEKCAGTGTDVGSDLVPPFIDIRTPQADATVNKSFTLQGDVNDQQSGVDRVEVYEGTVKLGNATIDSDAMTWSFDASLDDGRYTLIAVAFDKAGNTSRAEVNLKVKEGAGGGAESCTNPVNVPDEDLQRAIRDNLGLAEDAPITCEALAGLTELFKTGTDENDARVEFSTLEGLQFAVNLKELDINDAIIRDYSAIAGLTKLETLRINRLEASSLAPLRNLTALTTLELGALADDNFVYADQDALAPLVNLETLTISGLSDVTPLRNMTKLTDLFLGGGNVSDITPLENLTELKNLVLVFNKVSDITSLQGLTQLEKLDLTNNQVSSIAPLQSLSRLYLLDLSDNQISDLSPLQGLTELQSIELSGNPITDISPLVENEGLTGNPGFNAVYLENTPLETCPGTKGRADIDALIESGVQVIFDEPENCEGDNKGTIRVTSTSSAASLDGECTLRAAITAANTDTAIGGCPAGDGADTIVLSEGDSYTLNEVDSEADGSNGLPSITSEITVEGNGATIERQEGAPEFRLLHVAEAGNLTLTEVALANGTFGAAPGSDAAIRGGALFNAGKLDIGVNSAIRGSSVDEGFGGGLYNQGEATIRDSLITENTTAGQGAGFFNTGTLTIIGSAVISNSDGNATGFYNEGTLVMEASRVENNDTANAAGAFINTPEGVIEMTKVTISGNGDDGGGALNLGKMTLTEVVYDGNSDGINNLESATLNLVNSTVSNTGESQGPGLTNTGTLNVENSTISGNPLGGIGNSGTAKVSMSTIQGNSDPDDDRESQGMGISNGGTLTLSGSTVSGNGGGGVSNSGEMEIISSSVSDNGPFVDGIENVEGGTLSVTRSLVAGNGYYGIENAGSLSLTNSTVTGNYFVGVTNTETGTAEVAFSTLVNNDKDFFNSVTNEAESAAFSVFASIVDGVTNDLSDDPCENGATFVSEGYNLISETSTCGLSQDTDLVDVPQGLAAFGDNGGPTQTYALETDSPAINHIPADVCNVDTDQRGVSRPQGDACDIGAFEREQ